MNFFSQAVSISFALHAVDGDRRVFELFLPGIHILQ